MNNEENIEIKENTVTEETVQEEAPVQQEPKEETAAEEVILEETAETAGEEAAAEQAPVEEEKPEEQDTFEKVEVQAPSNEEAIVEGLLYVVGEDGAKIEQIASAIEKSIEDTKVILENIQRKYASELYGVELVAYGKVFKFVTKKEVFPYAQALFGETKPNTLSQSALETLAIIAYKQPITRVEIEELRGVGAEMMLRKLEARNLIKEAGRSDAPGRPILYEVTEEFMDSFKLYTLNELPDLPEYNNQDDQEKELFE